MSLSLAVVDGIIRRRLLVNFRADADVVQKLLPRPFRPKLEADHAIVGICLIRLEAIRPKGFPKPFGLASENAAHRIAVEWDDEGVTDEGVYIPRRDSNSVFNRVAGGRLFPGELHAAVFRVRDDGERVDVRMRSRDGAARVHVKGRTGDSLPATSVFDGPGQASAFFEAGSRGYSATRSGRRLDVVDLDTEEWSVKPFDIDRVESSFFSDTSLFPVGSVQFDCALAMRDVEHSWRAHHAGGPLRNG